MIIEKLMKIIEKGGSQMIAFFHDASGDPPLRPISADWSGL
jgi:hypothetical protein